MKVKPTEMIPVETISQKIFIIRSTKVMLDADLAEFYQVPTKVLNQAAKRNINRFPLDFMFQLTEIERNEVVTNCDHLTKLKFSHQLPFAFTEHGVAMLSSVLRSPRAVQINIFIVRAFIKLREMLTINKDVAQRVDILEREQEKHAEHILAINTVVKQLIDEPIKPKERIGFRQD